MGNLFLKAFGVKLMTCYIENTTMLYSMTEQFKTREILLIDLIEFFAASVIFQPCNGCDY